MVALGRSGRALTGDGTDRTGSKKAQIYCRRLEGLAREDDESLGLAHIAPKKLRQR